MPLASKWGLTPEWGRRSGPVSVVSGACAVGEHGEQGVGGVGVDAVAAALTAGPGELGVGAAPQAFGVNRPVFGGEPGVAGSPARRCRCGCGRSAGPATGRGGPLRPPPSAPPGAPAPRCRPGGGDRPPGPRPTTAARQSDPRRPRRRSHGRRPPTPPRPRTPPRSPRHPSNFLAVSNNPTSTGTGSPVWAAIHSAMVANPACFHTDEASTRRAPGSWRPRSCVPPPPTGPPRRRRQTPSAPRGRTRRRTRRRRLPTPPDRASPRPSPPYPPPPLPWAPPNQEHQFESTPFSPISATFTQGATRPLGVTRGPAWSLPPHAPSPP